MSGVPTTLGVQRAAAKPESAFTEKKGPCWLPTGRVQSTGHDGHCSTARPIETVKSRSIFDIFLFNNRGPFILSFHLVFYAAVDPLFSLSSPVIHNLTAR